MHLTNEKLSIILLGGFCGQGLKNYISYLEILLLYSKIKNNLCIGEVKMMRETISSQVINGAFGQIADSFKSKLENYIDERNKDTSWNNVVQEAIKATEGIDEEIGKYIFSQLSILNLKKHLCDKNHNNIHRKFVLTLAVELCKFDKEKDFSISLGTAVVDKWLEKNKLSTDCDSYDVEEFNRIISDREELYRNYFKLFEEKNGTDKIRIFYPKNGESWIRWEDKYSIDINVNLSKGLSYGFCREGFDYYKKTCDNDDKTLKCAYIENEKEILRFNGISCNEDNTIIWLR
jgi:hypothetical protein